MSPEGDLAMLKSELVLVYLMHSLLNKGRHVVLDNWYTSLQLAEYLLERNTLTTGTIRGNRVRLKMLPVKHWPRNNVLVTKFNDHRVVHVITTKYDGGFVEKTRHLRGGDIEMVKKKPTVIQRYNEQMGAVDIVDQLLEPYDLTRKSTAWFKKLGIHMVSRMVLNARIIYQILHRSLLSRIRNSPKWASKEANFLNRALVRPDLSP
ncbi:PiggyBac transposable element-derived protein 4 [Portunus trituberculatus]|uniref:PiggyBac transposable element-derived protein 4 n=1 Tax=Portunus trituberculatus TaxID=210409 RepID=A0A5B7E5K1_PORTR|nr:PiggyBac transposable element-derived protein 4 [Portunus trituberculatus]